MGTCFTEAREQNYRARDQELEVNNQASEVVSQRVQHDEKQRIALKIECANSIYSICLVALDSSVTTWTIVHEAPLFIEFLGQVYWSGLPFLPPEDLPDPGVEPTSPALAGR